MNLRVLSLHLERLGITDIRLATSGKEALALFAERPSEVVLTDKWMPRMNGTDLARRLRVCGSPAGLRVVVLSRGALGRRVFSALLCGIHQLIAFALSLLFLRHVKSDIGGLCWPPD